jgi:hypothetical protein
VALRLLLLGPLAPSPPPIPHSGRKEEWWREGVTLPLEHNSLVINIYFSILPNQRRARSDFRLISYVVNYGRVGKYNMRKSKR